MKALSWIVVIYLGVLSSALIPRTPPPTPFKRRPRGCDCYTISGPDPGYFQHYKIWDFRAVDLKKHAHLNLSEPIQGGDGDWDDWEDSDPDEDEEDGHIVPETRNPQPSDPTSLVFFKTSFERDWSSQAWERPGTPRTPVFMVNSKNNVFLAKDHERDDPHATYLVLRTTRHEDYTSTAEIETRLHSIDRCSLRVRLRLLPAELVMSQPPRTSERHGSTQGNNETTSPNQTIPSHEGPPPPGACAGIFTYHDRTSESDIEILTRDPPHRIHYANQPDYDFINDREVPGASAIVDMPVPWTSWATHRLDWLPDISRWFVNDEIQDARTYMVPSSPSMIVINLWSDGGLWTGDMKIGDNIYMGIEYIELLYNRSSNASHLLPVPPSKSPVQNIHLDPGISSASDWDHVKCKQGPEGRECRKQKFRNRPRAESCRRSCNIDQV